MKKILRTIVYPIYYVHYLLNKKKLNVNHVGQPLIEGISAVISMKDEEYTIETCIRSLIGFADQIICIDNGSQDKSVEIVKKLENEYVNLELVCLPGALLGDCRNEGLRRSKYSWHLRWDADMIAHTTGPNSMTNLRKKILNSDRPRTIQLPRINLNGDLYHTTKGKEEDNGEPILMRFTKDIIYKEFGKFDSIKVPYYYKQIKETKNYYLHCQGLKSDENLIHRFHYFTWREYTNQFPEFNLSKEEFIQRRNLYYFNTNNPHEIKYRYQRQNVLRFIKYDPKKFIDYPIELKNLMKKNNRFEVVYKKDKPFTRIDHNDKEMKNFNPEKNENDLWSINEFNNKLLTESYKTYC